MSFASVYRVTTKNRLVEKATIEALAKEIYPFLPDGYQEYLTSLGDGELCDLLRVRTPEEIRIMLADKRERDDHVAGLREDFWRRGILKLKDLEQAITFASSAEGDSFVCCPRFKNKLFELPRHADTIEIVENGFYGAVANSVTRMKHDFPFFEPWGHKDERRRHWFFDVRAGFGLAGFIAEIHKRWGRSECRRSRRPK